MRRVKPLCDESNRPVSVLVRLALAALFGGLRQEKDFLAMCTKEIWIDTRHKRVRVALDGEVRIMEPPLHYRVLPGKLRVLTPAISQTAQGQD